MLSYTISEEDHCRSVGSFLRNLLPAASTGYLRKLLKSGHFAVNGQSAGSSETLLRLGDRLVLKESGKTGALLTGKKPLLDILYEDDWIIVINKPAGLPMHAAAEVDDRNLVDLGSRMLAERDRFAGKLRPVNRLDRGTSGGVIMARSSTAAGMFGRVVKEEGLGKTYLAVAQGVLPEVGTITQALAGKEAQTSFRRLFQGDAAAFIAAYPVTGRMHQIRRHFQSIGHSIAGDVRYGGRPLAGYDGILLHSFRTTFLHPATGGELTVWAPLSPQFLNLLRHLAGDALPALLASLPEIPPDSSAGF